MRDLLDMRAERLYLSVTYLVAPDKSDPRDRDVPPDQWPSDGVPSSLVFVFLIQLYQTIRSDATSASSKRTGLNFISPLSRFLRKKSSFSLQINLPSNVQPP